MKDKNILNNVGKSMGSANKATLPNGENLSNKIKQNKVNNGVNASKNMGVNSSKTGATEGVEGNQSAINNKNNKKAKQNGGKTSTGLPDVQGMGAEVAREALKQAAGVVPYTRWIPKGIRDKIIDKFMDSDAGQALVEKAFAQIRMRIILAGVGLVCGVLLLLFITAAIFTLILSPVAWVRDAWKAVSEQVISFGNFVLGRGWCVDDCQDDLRSYYYNRLNVEAEKYKEQCNVDLNKELITATIFYDRMVSKKQEDVESGQFDHESNTNDFYYKYNKDDASEVSDLIYVYKNQSYKATCPVITDEVEKKINDFISLIKGKFTAADLDNLILEHDKIPTIADIEKQIGKLTAEETTLWNEIVVSTKNNVSCFTGIWMRIKSVVGAGDDPCLFNEDNYKNYLITYYIPTNYAYLTNDEYRMTYEDIADEILKMGEILDGGNLTFVEDTDGLFTMLPAGLNLGISSNPAHCRCHPVKHVWQSHKGVDIGGVPYGTEIVAFADGVVTENIIATSKSCGSSIIKLKHTNENGEVYYTRYVHLNRKSNTLLSNLTVGTNVSKGQVIGYVGGTVAEDSCSTGSHLHFEIHNSESKPINPVVALNNVKNGIDILANQEVIETCAYNGGAC